MTPQNVVSNKCFIFSVDFLLCNYLEWLFAYDSLNFVKEMLWYKYSLMRKFNFYDFGKMSILKFEGVIMCIKLSLPLRDTLSKYCFFPVFL